MLESEVAKLATFLPLFCHFFATFAAFLLLFAAFLQLLNVNVK
jgi:hypothetical protein